MIQLLFANLVAIILNIGYYGKPVFIIQHLIMQKPKFNPWTL